MDEIFESIKYNVENSAKERNLEIKKPQEIEHRKKEENKSEKFKLKKIGTIHTPYIDTAPYQPVKEDQAEFKITVDPQYIESLHKLDKFRYIYVLYYIHLVSREINDIVSPPWTGGAEVGAFASRSPLRPNLIGLSVVQLKKIEGNNIFISSIDCFDGTPLLDIKPYIKDLDSKSDANYGWIEDLDGYEHLLLHIKGIPHDY
ncbi:MAG: tRNA (N6-threonylcarbamoyladenosine(37)-N6)-methyltransferase TrmO [Promethearchaeati archaeon]